MHRKMIERARAVGAVTRIAALLLATFSANPVLAQSSDAGQVTVPSSGVPLTPLPSAPTPAKLPNVPVAQPVTQVPVPAPVPLEVPE